MLFYRSYQGSFNRGKFVVKWVFSILQNTWKYSVYADNRKLDIKFHLTLSIKSCIQHYKKENMFDILLRNFWYHGIHICMKENLIHYRTCVCNINYHMVWSVKYRRKILNAEVEACLQELVQETMYTVLCQPLRNYP